jgi:hypothetical protein
VVRIDHAQTGQLAPATSWLRCIAKRPGTGIHRGTPSPPSRRCGAFFLTTLCASGSLPVEFPGKLTIIQAGNFFQEDRL